MGGGAEGTWRWFELELTYQVWIRAAQLVVGSPRRGVVLMLQPGAYFLHHGKDATLFFCGTPPNLPSQ